MVLISKDLKGTPEKLDLKAKRESKVILEPRDQKETQAIQARRESKDLKALLEMMERTGQVQL